MSVPGVSKYPVGVYDHAPDPDASFIQSVGVGRGRAAEFGKEVTGLANELNGLLAKIPGV